MNDIAPMLVFITIALVIGWSIRTLAAERTARALLTAQSDLHSRLLDRCSSAQELATYLESDLAKKMFDLRLLHRSEPFARLLAAVRTGILVIAAGIGLLLVTGMIPGHARDGFTVLGTLCVVVGTGFLVSGAVSYWLAKRLGLVGSPEPEESQG